MASISNIFIDQGATFTTTVTVTDANGDAVNLSGYSVAAQIRKTFLSSSATALQQQFQMHHLVKSQYLYHQLKRLL